MSSRKQISLNETLTELYIKHTTQDEYMTRKIMSFLFPDVAEYKFMRCESGHFFNIDKNKCPYCIDEIVKVNKLHVVDKYKSDKHKEILDSLEYLKSKETKTKQDKESIHTLEVILKNFS